MHNNNGLQNGGKINSHRFFCPSFIFRMENPSTDIIRQLIYQIKAGVGKLQFAVLSCLSDNSCDGNITDGRKISTDPLAGRQGRACQRNISDFFCRAYCGIDHQKEWCRIDRAKFRQNRRKIDRMNRIFQSAVKRVGIMVFCKFSPHQRTEAVPGDFVCADAEENQSLLCFF